MKSKSFSHQRENAVLTATTLATAASNILLCFNNCTPENVGEILKDVVNVSGTAQLLLIDYTNLLQAE